ncbi:TPA: hypothetical protein DEG21_02085 [Patescibacteria group bacterium]|nr:hypothetical protein [Candidatus Gracilibacteria bacterium]HBY74671.1 hypothetical protein [Candidatus Gracilibacteria bacterium]
MSHPACPHLSLYFLKLSISISATTIFFGSVFLLNQLVNKLCKWSSKALLFQIQVNLSLIAFSSISFNNSRVFASSSSISSLFFKYSANLLFPPCQFGSVVHKNVFNSQDFVVIVNATLLYHIPSSSTFFKYFLTLSNSSHLYKSDIISHFSL